MASVLVVGSSRASKMILPIMLPLTMMGRMTRGLTMPKSKERTFYAIQQKATNLWITTLMTAASWSEAKIFKTRREAIDFRDGIDLSSKYYTIVPFKIPEPTSHKNDNKRTR